MVGDTGYNFSSEYWGWSVFIEIFEKEIAPVYKRKEKEFDPAGIHGVMHASRTILFAELMIRYYHEKLNVKWDPEKVNIIRFAAALHDSGRMGNGPDIWEKESAEFCYEFLLSKRFSETDALLASKYILKTADNDARFIMCDADVLEIMRPNCGHGGINGFRPEHLIFLSDSDTMLTNSDLFYKLDRIRFIEEAWQLVLFSETDKSHELPNQYIGHLLELISTEKRLSFMRQYLR